MHDPSHQRKHFQCKLFFSEKEVRVLVSELSGSILNYQSNSWFLTAQLGHNLAVSLFNAG